MRLVLDLEGPDSEYFTACARIRDIAPTSLLRRVMVAVCQDQLVASVLDDQGNMRMKAKGEHRFETPKRAGIAAEAWHPPGTADLNGVPRAEE